MKDQRCGKFVSTTPIYLDLEIIYANLLLLTKNVSALILFNRRELKAFDYSIEKIRRIQTKLLFLSKISKMRIQ